MCHLCIFVNYNSIQPQHNIHRCADMSKKSAVLDAKFKLAVKTVECSLKQHRHDQQDKRLFLAITAMLGEKVRVVSG